LFCFNSPNKLAGKEKSTKQQRAVLVFSSVLESIKNCDHMAGLLTYSVFERLPIGLDNQQWQKICSKLFRVYSSGTVAEFHGIPF